jgi:potassium-dependent mechanosensitive channel
MLRILVSLLCSLLLWQPLAAQESTPSPTATPTASVTPTPAVIPLAEIVSRLETDRETLQRVREETQVQTSTTQTEEALQALEALPDPASSDADDLRAIEREWSARDNQLSESSRLLEQRTEVLDAELRRLEETEQTWRGALVAFPDLPAELSSDVERFLTELATVRQTAVSSRSEVLVLLSRIARQQTRIKGVLNNLAQAREAQVQQALRSQQRPLWQSDVRRVFSAAGTQQLRRSWQRQLSELSLYGRERGERFLLHAVVLLVLVLALNWTRRRIEPWIEEEPALQRTRAAFYSPVLTALLLSVFLNGWIYPEAPPALRVFLGMLAVLPANLVIRCGIDVSLRPLLNLLITLFFVDQFRNLTATHAALSRLLFNLEVLGAAAYLLVVLPSIRSHHRVSFLVRVALATLIAAFLTSAVGFVELGYLLLNGVLRSAYVGVFLYALIRILEGLFMVLLRVPPLSLLHLVREHRRGWRVRFRTLLSLFAVYVWCVSLLDHFGLAGRAAEWVNQAGTWGIQLGAVRITLGAVLALLLTLWLTYRLSVFLRFALEQDVYPRTHLNRGVTYTLSTLVHYLVLTIGVLLALATLGIDTTKFVVVAGALGVGIGFGLQNIVNNFVSGLILLFERPVKVGDLVEITGQRGHLQSIGLRASVLRTFDGADVIVPNGEILANQVTNWTGWNQRRRMSIPVGVAYGTPPEQVQQLLLQVARANPDVLADPAPEALFRALADSSLNFELRAWTDQFTRWEAVQSELLVGVLRALDDAGIDIPFPQRTVRIVREGDGAPS